MEGIPPPMDSSAGSARARSWPGSVGSYGFVLDAFRHYESICAHVFINGLYNKNPDFEKSGFFVAKYKHASSFCYIGLFALCHDTMFRTVHGKSLHRSPRNEP